MVTKSESDDSDDDSDSDTGSGSGSGSGSDSDRDSDTGRYLKPRFSLCSSPDCFLQHAYPLRRGRQRALGLGNLRFCSVELLLQLAQVLLTGNNQQQ